MTEHFFSVPKDYSNPSSGNIKLFARSVRKHDTAADPSTTTENNAKQLPWMVYLQGGPGMSCRSPQSYPFTSTLLDKGYQILFLDQRGTGLSTPVTPSTLGLRGPNDVQAKYLKLYRADNIVRDCEAIRLALTSSFAANKRKWSIMGQSFGGFISLSYLSFYPEGLVESFIYGGLQPLVHEPDDVYRRLYRKVLQRNEAYYAKYPEDIARVKTVVRYLRRFGDGTIKLPSEGKLTARRFLQMGINLGFHGGVDAVHEVVLKAAADVADFGHLTRGTLSAIEKSAPFDDHLIYSVLHEPIYCNGKAPRWAAERIMKEYPQFNVDVDGDGNEMVCFTGEMVYSWMFEDYSELRKVADVAERVSRDEDWPPLWDEEQLAKNEVPVYAAAYVEDMYVDHELSRETAKKVKGCKMFETNIMYHNALGEKSKEVVEQLFAFRDDVID